MKVTISQLSDFEEQFAKDWEALKSHTHLEKPDLLLLPEMPFSQWIASGKTPKEEAKQASVAKHEKWLKRLGELSAEMIVYSKPVSNGGLFHNTAFLWDRKSDEHYNLHSKTFFPEEEHFHEDSWYDAGDRNFDVFEINGLRIGVLLCTEVWFTQYARAYGEQGIDLLLCPRATGASSVAQWIRCGQTLSIISGAYCLSSNRAGDGTDNFKWGGHGWLSRPMDGTLLGETNDAAPFVTTDIDLSISKEAKKEYPLYVKTTSRPEIK